MNQTNFLLNTDISDWNHELQPTQKLRQTYESCSSQTKPTKQLYMNPSVVHICCLSSSWLNPAHLIAACTNSSSGFYSKETWHPLSLKVKPYQKRHTHSKTYQMLQAKLCDYLPKQIKSYMTKDKFKHAKSLKWNLLCLPLSKQTLKVNSLKEKQIELCNKIYVTTYSD